MARLIFAPQAVDDMRDVRADLTERAGPLIADSYTEQFRSAFERLPRIRAPAAHVRVSAATSASLLFGPTLSSTERNDVVILRVVHGHRKITRRTVTERTDQS